MKLDLTPWAREQLPAEEQIVLRGVLPDSFVLRVGAHGGGSWTARLLGRFGRALLVEVFEQPSARAAAWAAIRRIFP